LPAGELVTEEVEREREVEDEKEEDGLEAVESAAVVPTAATAVVDVDEIGCG
jgi:hypothetical protein